MKSKIVVLFLGISLCLCALSAKLIIINQGSYERSAQTKQTKTITIGSSRGKIYDRNLKKLVDEKETLIAAVTPDVRVIKDKSAFFDIEKLQEKLKEGKPFTARVSRKVNNSFVSTFEIFERCCDSAACHLVGYVDSSGKHGLYGIEKAYDGLLKKESGTLSVSYTVDAKGKVLSGLGKVINDNHFNSSGGVVLTIDKEIQKICENALSKSKIKSGCALVMHVDSGEIYAMASVPTFDRNAVYKSFGKENSPLVNKALSPYSVGSVFKPLIAACALESGLSKKTQFDCNGELTIGDTTFCCFDKKAHGKQTMTQALENSCNTYFINLIESLDEDYLLAVCKLLGLGNQTSLAQNFSSRAGTLPTALEFEKKGEKANFAFGQGKLLATPIDLLSIYHALATGNYVKPTVLRGIANENGLMTAQSPQNPTKIFSDKTVKKIRSMLKSVVENGNAYDAKSRLLSLSGKTGTAQSGISKGSKEICRTWFAGFFPSDNPHYVVVVFNEDGSGGNVECAPVFKEICEEIALCQK